MLNIFTYGSLMTDDIMQHVANGSFKSSQATLKNYFRSAIHNEEYPAIISQQATEVSGVVYFDVNSTAVKRLDLFEGEYYERKKVIVILPNTQTVEAMAYVLKTKYQGILTGREWDYNYFLKNGKDKFLTKYFGFKEI